tara:strand:+ start:178 stop:459 length:282 start_codon:yes stop_codon:yes gene_type:complete
MLDLQAIEIIEEIASRSGRPVYRVMRMLGWCSPVLEGEVVKLASRRGHSKKEARAWYTERRERLLRERKMGQRVEAHIASRQRRVRISRLLSG